MRNRLIVVSLVFGLLGCGQDGPSGPAGAQGAAGSPGAIGPTGSVGATGPEGAPGTTSDAGAATGRRVVWKDATGAVIDVVSAETGTFLVVDSAGRMWNTSRMGVANTPTHARYFSGLDCTGTEYTIPEFAARMPFALNEARTELRVWPDNFVTIQATALSQRSTVGTCSNSSHTGGLALLSDAPVNPALVGGQLLFAPPLHAEIVP